MRWALPCTLTNMLQKQKHDRIVGFLDRAARQGELNDMCIAVISKDGTSIHGGIRGYMHPIDMVTGLDLIQADIVKRHNL